jgi:hypothetical protein
MRSFDRPGNGFWIGAFVVAATPVLFFGQMLLALADSSKFSVDTPALASQSAPAKSYAGAPVGLDDRSTMVLDRTGQCIYFCDLHPHLKGKIIVSP